jgi:hypothetical protein
MPTGVQNYQNGKIYKIWSLLTDKIYIGSTCNDLPHRFKQHKKNNNNCNSKLLFDEVGFENCKIELIEYYPCNSKLELTKREGEIQRENKEFIVNTKIESRTRKEYKNDNSEKIKAQDKLYQINNKDKIKEYLKNNKDKTNAYKRKWEQNNKEKSDKLKKDYYENNKEKILEKYTCECGATIVNNYKTRHEKTNKHQNYIK